MSLPDAVLFDLDGLLLDTERLILEISVNMLNDMGFSVTPDFFHGFTGRSDTEVAEILTNAFPDLDVPAYEKANKAAVLARYEQGIPLKDGALDLLEYLKSTGMPTAVGTNSRVESGMRKLGLSGLDRYFEVLVGFDVVANAKPAPDIYIEAARRLGTTADRCVVFEDSDTGVTAAHAAGAFVIQVPDMTPPRTTLPHRVAATLTEGARAHGLLP